MTTNDKINQFLAGRKLPVSQYRELRWVGDQLAMTPIDRLNKIFGWFRFVQDMEIPGWRTRQTDKKMIEVLVNNSESNKLVFYALFCPSYKKGDGKFGFRTDGVGQTSLSGMYNLMMCHDKALELGFVVDNPLAIFFDLALEQYDLLVKENGVQDLETNIANLKKIAPPGVSFLRLSDMGTLEKEIGYRGLKGCSFDKTEILDRIVERGKKFYKLFGWTDEQIKERSTIVANSEHRVAQFLKDEFPHGIMVYTPTMLERAEIYSSKIDAEQIPILFPQK